FFTDSEKIIFQNLNGYSINRGASLNAEFNFDTGVKITLGGTYTDIFIAEKDVSTGKTTRKEQALTPYFTGNGMVSYTFPKGNIVIDYTLNAVSPMRLPVVENDYRS